MATPYIPFKSNMTGGTKADYWQKLHHIYAFHRDEFLTHYHRRSNMESTVSMFKAKFGDALRSKTDIVKQNGVLCKVLCHNLCVLIQSFYEFGIDLGRAAGMIQPATPSMQAMAV